MQIELVLLMILSNQQDIVLPLLIDPVSLGNPFSKVYSPWPIRFYVIGGRKKLSYIAEPIEGSYPLESIKNAMG